MTDGYCDAIVEAFERRYDGVLRVVPGRCVCPSLPEPEPRHSTYGTDVLDGGSDCTPPFRVPDIDDYSPEAVVANMRREERAKWLEGR